MVCTSLGSLLGPMLSQNRLHSEILRRQKDNSIKYTEAKVDVTQEIEQKAQQAAQAGADHCALFSISCVTSSLASV